MGPWQRFVITVVSLALGPASVLAQASVTTPEEHFGFPIGADYRLATYSELEEYWEILARESNRMVLDTIGATTEGRAQLMAIVSAPENLEQRERHRSISERLTRARGVSPEEAARISRQGRAVVWIDGGLHADEVLGAQQLIELVYRMVSSEDPEILRILDDVILLAAHANPDGHEMVADWYMRTDDPLDRSTEGLPVLYQRYAGHDNNRDFYMSNLEETTNINRVLYREWYPQIIYNHHQSGPVGTIMFAPPFRDPANHYIEPMVLTSLEQVGAAMHQRFVEEGKGGTTMRSGGRYSTWWNGGLRTTPYFHNMIGILTETRGHPNPISIPFVPRRQQRTNSDLPLPVEPTEIWHFRQSVEYSMTANLAILDFASRNSDRLLLNAWRMGRSAIEKGSRDHWTDLPDEIESAADALGSMRAAGTRSDRDTVLRRQEDRDPRGYILPADQVDFGRAVRLANALLKAGVEVHRATARFTVGDRSYPSGSLIVRTDQAFRAHVLDMFERQDHPDTFEYPGGPPIPPYDITGWTLALQMGVHFDRVLDGFGGPFEPLAGPVDDTPSLVDGPAGGAGWILDGRVSDSFRAVNALLAEGVEVAWVSRDGLPGLEAGVYYVSSTSGSAESLRRALATSGADARSVEEGPDPAELHFLRAPRIGLWDVYGGSAESGWTRFVLESFGFDHRLVFAQELNAGDLSDEFDVLVFPDGAIPERGTGRLGSDQPSTADVPSRWRSRLGAVSVDSTVPRLLEFLDQGGTIIAVGSSTSMGSHADLPIANWLVDDLGRPLTREEFYIPGAVLEMRLADEAKATRGMGDRVHVLFDESPVFEVTGDAVEEGVQPLAWFESDNPLRSGWAWQQERLRGATAAVEASVGDGTLVLIGPDITFRGQTHGAFHLLFNSILFHGTGESLRAAE